jgi:NFACT protein RNA binding domain/NFACT N-terminal and middle domains
MRNLQAGPVAGNVQRVRVVWLGPHETALFDVRAPGETVHLVCASGLGMGILEGEARRSFRDAMKGATVSAAQPFWRVRFEGAHVRAGLRAFELAPPENVARTRAQVDARTRAQVDARTVRVEATEAGALRLVDGTLDDADLAGRDALEARGAAIAAALVRIGIDGRRDALRRALGKAIARVTRRVAAVEGDLVRIDGADDLARRAQTFVVAAASAPRGVDRLRATDWTSGEAREVELPIDPARGAREQIDALFKRARRLKEGAKIAHARIAAAKSSLDGLVAALANLAAPDADLDALTASARAAALHDFKGGPSPDAREAAAPAPGRAGKGSRDLPRPPYRLFFGASGARILVGRGAAHNDTLTLRVARPHDLWLHAKDRNGAHVIVAMEKGASCPADLLVEAAHLAAHFSDAREERLVDVQYTPRKYLRKPRGSPPGLVVVDREKVLVLRKDDATLKRLLETEPPV